MENDTFCTKDIYLAVFLQINGVKLVNVTPDPDSNRYAAFHFVNPSRDLLTEWVTNCPTKAVINSYRHLTRRAHIATEGPRAVV